MPKGIQNPPNTTRHYLHLSADTFNEKRKIQYSPYQKQIPRRYLVIWDLPNQSGYINDTINASAPHKELLNIREESTHMNTSSATV